MNSEVGQPGPSETVRAGEVRVKGLQALAVLRARSGGHRPQAQATLSSLRTAGAKPRSQSWEEIRRPSDLIFYFTDKGADAGEGKRVPIVPLAHAGLDPGACLSARPFPCPWRFP